MTLQKQLLEAAQWFMELERPDVDPQKFAEWQQWMRTDATHHSAYATFERQMRFKVARSRLVPTAQEMAADEYDGSMSVSQWQALRRRPRRSSWARYGIAAGVAVLGVIGAGGWLHGQYRAQHGVFAFQTAAGERREFKLPEGSKVTLDANSALTVRLAPEQRLLRLTRGEAYFEVAKDPARPFKVRAGNAEVRAVGTAFDVRISGNRTIIAVTEGRVEVTSDEDSRRGSDSSDETPEPSGRPTQKEHGAQTALTARVSAGEAVSYARDAGLDALPAVEASLATAWIKGRRQYRNEPLRYVLADIGRYTGKQIAMADEATGELRFTGTLDLENSDAWLKGLSVALPVKVRQTATGGLVVESR